MQRQHTGRPGSRVFPADWQETHAGIIATTYEATIRIVEAGTEPTWNPATNKTESQAANPIYTGAATLTAISDSDRQVDVVEEPESLRRYEVKVDVDLAGVDPDIHFVYVDTCPDTDLVGKRLSIASVKRGDRRFSRVLYATLND